MLQPTEEGRSTEVRAEHASVIMQCDDVEDGEGHEKSDDKDSSVAAEWTALTSGDVVGPTEEVMPRGAGLRSPNAQFACWQQIFSRCIFYPCSSLLMYPCMPSRRAITNMP